MDPQPPEMSWTWDYDKVSFKRPVVMQTSRSPSHRSAGEKRTYLEAYGLQLILEFIENLEFRFREVVWGDNVFRLCLYRSNGGS